MPDTTLSLDVCATDPEMNTTVFPATTLQTLDRRVGKNQLFFAKEMFAASVNDWSGIPVIYHPDGIHPTNFDAVAKDPASAAADIGGTLIGTVSNPRITIPGGPRLMAELDIGADEEILALWQQGKLFPSTAFTAESDGDRITSPPVPNHVLLFPYKKDLVVPGDPGAFVNTIEVPTPMTNNLENTDSLNVNLEPLVRAIDEIRSDLELIKSALTPEEDDQEEFQRISEELQTKTAELTAVQADLAAAKADADAKGKELIELQHTVAETEFASLLQKLPVGMTATEEQRNSIRSAFDAGNMKQLLFSVLEFRQTGATEPAGVTFTHSAPVKEETVGDLSKPKRRGGHA